jgi:hypothetical protein
MSETRKLAAILVADVVGYSRLAGADEERTLARLRGLRSDLFDPAVAAHRGRVVKRTGDGSIIEFRSAVDAVRCAIEVQNGLAERNAGVPEERRIRLRVGIHVGDVVEEGDGDLMGAQTYRWMAPQICAERSRRGPAQGGVAGTMSETRKLAAILAASPRPACGERVRERGRESSRAVESSPPPASPLIRPLPASGERRMRSAEQ